ncbi:MAG: tetratricopeptide repeat protein [Ignavibacteria bacterium]
MIEVFFSAFVQVMILALFVFVIGFIARYYYKHKNLSDLNTAKSLKDDNDLYTAMEKINKLLDRDSDYFNAYYEKALIYMKMKKYDYAIVNFTRYISYNPGLKYCEETMLKRGECYYNVKDYKLAVMDLEAVKNLLDDRLKIIYEESLKIYSNEQA